MPLTIYLGAQKDLMANMPGKTEVDPEEAKRQEEQLQVKFKILILNLAGTFRRWKMLRKIDKRSGKSRKMLEKECARE